MERTEFEGLVAQMEQRAAADPEAYRRRVVIWALLGYGFMGLLVVTLLVLCVLLLLGIATLKAAAVKLLIILVPLLWVVVRAMWIRFAPPEGMPLTRADAPALFAMLGGLRQRLDTPRIDAVLLTPEFNAGVMQTPRFGLLGGTRSTLLIGLPLMKALSVPQFEAVLAHELGHLSRGHARLGNWIYRLRLIWSRMDAQLAEQEGWLVSGIQRFFRWYAPRFNAISFPLARANEYEADAASAQLTSPAAAAQALTGVEVVGRYFDAQYWPGIHAGAKDHPRPEAAPYTAFVGHAVLELPAAQVDRWRTEALSRPTTSADTHPSLADRLAALGAAPDLALPGPGEGSERLLGDALADAQQRLDAEWREQVAPSWAEYHDELRQARERRVALVAQGDPVALPEGSLLELAALEERVGDGADAALALRRLAVQRFPQSVDARFLLGRDLLLADDVAGCALLQDLVRESPAVAAAGSELLRDYYLRQGDRAAAARWQETCLAEHERLAAAREERGVIRIEDSFVPNALDAGTLQALREAVRTVPGLHRVYVVRKLTTHFTDEPFHVIGFTCTPWYALRSESRIAKCTAALHAAVQLPGDAMFVCVDNPNHRFARLFRKVAGARIL